LALADAQDTFAAKDGEAFVNSFFIPLAKKNGLEEKVGLGLLHHHFDLEGRREAGGMPISPRFPFQDGEILPPSWPIQEGRFIPYEPYSAPLNSRPTFKSVDLTDLNPKAF
jgi:hypothetical protein